jgi:hypothetical protein
MPIKIENGHLLVEETHKNSRGGRYVYAAKDFKLVPISRFFRPSRKEDVDVIYDISIKDEEKVLGPEIELIEFSFSNKGYLYITTYRINSQDGSLTQEFHQSNEIFGRYKFYVLGEELQALKEYGRTVPRLIERVREIEKRLNLRLNITGTRGEEVYIDPELGRFTSMIFPNPKSRAKSLKEKIRFAHELYVLMLAINSISANINEKTLLISHEEYPTFVTLGNCPLTLWYQFSIKDWFEVVKRGLISFFTDSSAKKIRRIHIKPDIMIFNGIYRRKEDVLKNPPQNSILIDAKVEITNSDVKQLREYRKRFGDIFKNSTFIVASIGKAPYKEELETLGYIVIEDVFPDKPGEKEFQETIKVIINKWI